MLKCDLCGREGFKHAGALELHKVHCPKKQGKESKKLVNDDVCKDCGKSNTYRLLDPKALVEKEMIDSGYVEVCVECLELR